MKSIIQPARAPSIWRAARLLSEGQLVGVPTETVYGLAANAWDAAAVSRVFAVKGRPACNPLIVHLASLDRLADAVALPLPPAQQRWLDPIADLFPGPLTVVLPRNRRIPDVVTAARDTVAVRVPAHPVMHRLLRVCPFPLAAPSANKSACVSPTTAEHVAESLGFSLELILDGGACAWGLESTIVSLAPPQPRVLRPGSVAAELLAERWGLAVDLLCDPRPHAAAPSLEAPGMMALHYAPSTPLQLGPPAGAVPEGQRVGRIAFQRLPAAETAAYAALELLSQTGDLSEVAHGLFAALRRLDRLGLDRIVCDTCETTGLGRAIMDRLRRAAADSQPPAQGEK